MLSLLVQVYEVKISLGGALQHTIVGIKADSGLAAINKAAQMSRISITDASGNVSKVKASTITAACYHCRMLLPAT